MVAYVIRHPVGWSVASEVGWLVGWWYLGLRLTECAGHDHVHAAREGSEWLTPLPGLLGFGLESRRVAFSVTLALVVSQLQKRGCAIITDRRRSEAPCLLRGFGRVI